MNITVIYGSMGKTITYDCVQLLLTNLELNIKIRINEFFLPKCNLENNYYLQPNNYLNVYLSTTVFNSIVKSLNDSDLIILASPVFKCEASAEMKLFMDSLYHHCISNNDDTLMHNKLGLIISTTAGAGLFHTTRTLKRNLNFLGVNNTLKFSKNLYETNLNNINLKTQKQITRKILKLSYKILDLYYNSRTAKKSLLSKITFLKTNPIINSNKYNVIDLNYWKKQSCYHSRNI